MKVSAARLRMTTKDAGANQFLAVLEKSTNTNGIKKTLVTFAVSSFS